MKMLENLKDGDITIPENVQKLMDGIVDKVKKHTVKNEDSGSIG